MNGRIYDPLLGRFLSADVVVQAPGNLQSYNRYSYVMNNPLTMTDPSGFTIDDPKDNSLYKRAEQLRDSNNAGDRLKAAGLYLLASPKMMLDANAHAFRTQLPAKIGEIKNDIAQKNASGEISGGRALLMRAAITTAEIGTAPQTLLTNLDRIPGAVAEFPGKVATDVKEAIKNPTANNLYNIGEDASAIYGGVKMVQGAVSSVRNAVAASTETVAAGDVAAGQTPNWPPDRGFEKPPNPVVLQTGSVVDRVGDPNGAFVAPQGTPFEARSLPASFADKPLNAYEVAKPIDVNAGLAAPWFGQPGKGVQFELPKTVQELLESGHLVEKK